MKQSRILAVTVTIFFIFCFGIFCEGSETNDFSKKFTKIARQMEAATVAGNYLEIEKFIDYDAFISRIFRGTKVDKKKVDEFRTSFLSKGGVVSLSLKQTKSTIVLSKIYQKNGRYRVLFRVQGKQGINYLDFEGRVAKGGSVCFVDAYSYMVGENLSETIRRMVLPIVEYENKSFLGKMISKEPEILSHTKAFMRMSRYAKTGKYKQVLAEYKKFPENIRRQKIVLVTAISAAVQIDEGVMLQSLADTFQREFPNDPSRDLILIDYYFNKKMYAKTRVCVDGLTRQVGKDAALLTIKGNTFLFEEKFSVADHYYKQAIKVEPDYIDAYWSLVSSHIYAKNWRKVAMTLDLIEEKFELEFQNLAEIDFYKEFAASKEGKAWLKARQL